MELLANVNFKGILPIVGTREQNTFQISFIANFFVHKDMLIRHSRLTSLVVSKNVKIKALILSVILYVRKAWYLTVMVDSRVKLILFIM